MRRGEPRQATHNTNGFLFGLDGMVVMLKVMGLLAGYAIFVWMTMTQMERRYLAPTPEPAGADRESLEPVAVPGAVLIQGRSSTRLHEPAASSRTAPQPGRGEVF